MKIESKIDFIVRDSLQNDPENHETFLEIQCIIKDFGKSRNKSSKQIIAFNLMKKRIESIHENVVARAYLKMEVMYNIPTLKALIDNKNFKIFDHANFNTEREYLKSEMITDILQLKLPDLDTDYSLFFLSDFHRERKIMEIDFLNPQDIHAKDKTTFYGETSYTFPPFDGLSSTELIAIRTSLDTTTEEFRKRIEAWASICYTNPNTNLGLDYFIKKVQPYLQSTKNDILENPLLQNTSILTNKNLESQIIIGEAPIEKIWELYLISNTITQKIYDDLMKIKTAEFPKFEGRWPVVFFKPTEAAKKFMTEERQNDGVQSVRKSISLD
ncbi:hypothetical protein [Flavobacterium sp. SM2513]|uniref:hypothetical protein n=1 Tax=Flavobacterium sp. SM2513 TaxID=3424766 RepID=UPI003D7F2D8F